MQESNPNTRLEAFCDGVFAIAMTLLIIDIKIPSTVVIQSESDFWLALKHILPSIFAFVLSFGVILITWVNHHSNLRLVNKSCASFLYANGFLLLTVVFIPFPTALLGEYLLTDHAGPAVVLYNSVLTLQALSWIVISRSAVKNHLVKSSHAESTMRKNGRFGYFALTLYALFAVMAIWFPRTIAALTSIIWIFWLVYSIRFKHEE